MFIQVLGSSHIFVRTSSSSFLRELYKPTQFFFLKFYENRPRYQKKIIKKFSDSS
jgi:hypothetical protein